ncbi:hypothetical protein INT43_004724 [Umbelopsis isabellina]|uniref:Uncharacterized protein n=1 Tax=Mortierella isabellina TaxID=91625 RepID=A0A8H7PGN3_MORIS|nr:hypothetical protein INT43_004724 [Umbelopsis isabellina]
MMNHRSNRIQLDSQESWTKALWPQCNCCFQRQGAIRLDDDDAESPRHARSRMFLFDQHQRDMEFESLLSDEEDQNLAGNINLFLGDDDEWLETDAELVPVDRINKLLQPNQELSTLRRGTDTEPQQADGSQDFPQPYIIRDLRQNAPATFISIVPDETTNTADSIADSMTDDVPVQLANHSDEPLLSVSPSVDAFSPRPSPLSNIEDQQEGNDIQKSDFVLDTNQDLLDSASEREGPLVDLSFNTDREADVPTDNNIEQYLEVDTEDVATTGVEENLRVDETEDVEENMTAEVLHKTDNARGTKVDAIISTMEDISLSASQNSDKQTGDNETMSSTEPDSASELVQEVSALAIPLTPEAPAAVFPKQAPMTVASEISETPPPQDPQPSYNAGRRSSVAQVAQTYLGDKLEDLTEKLTFIKKNIIMSLEEDDEDEDEQDRQLRDRSVPARSSRPPSQQMAKEPLIAQRPARHSSLSRISTIERRDRERERERDRDREPEYMQITRPNRPSVERFNSFQEEASASFSRIFSKITSNDRSSFSPSSFFAALSGNEEEPLESASDERAVPVRTSSRGAIDPQPRSDVRNAEQRTQSLRRQSSRRANAPPNIFEEEVNEQTEDEIPFDFGKVLEMGKTIGKSFGEDVMQNGLKMFNDVSDRMKSVRRRGSEENWLGKDNWFSQSQDTTTAPFRCVEMDSPGAVYLATRQTQPRLRLSTVFTSILPYFDFVNTSNKVSVSYVLAVRFRHHGEAFDIPSGDLSAIYVRNCKGKISDQECPRFTIHYGNFYTQLGRMEFLFNREIKHHGDFCAVKYCLLKYPECATRWVLGKDEDLDACAVFSLLVNNNYSIASKYIETYAEDMKLEPLTYCTVDDFQPASKEICQWLNDSFSDFPSWNYYVTAWNIMGDYDLPNLKYAYDHEKLAERLNKKLPDHDITLTFSYRGGYVEGYMYDTVVHGDQKLEIRNKGFKDSSPSLDNACILETSDWKAVGGFDGSPSPAACPAGRNRCDAAL